MKRIDIKLCLVAVISLLLSVIWHVSASAAVAPSIVPLGRITEGLAVPMRIDVDASGNIYVSDTRTGAVLKYSKYGKLIAKFATARASGYGLAVTPDGSYIYVATGNAVSILDGMSGAPVGFLGLGAGEFISADEIDLDAEGYVFVADAAARVIKVYTPDGQFHKTIGGVGTTAGLFWVIRAMSVNPATGEVYVVDPSSGSGVPRIQVFDHVTGQLLRTIGYTGFSTPYIAFPAGVAFDQSGRGYFLESFYSDIRIMGLPSTFLAKYGTAGYLPGQLNKPVDAAFDPETKRLFVVCDGGRVEIFGIDGGQNPAKANVAPNRPVALSPVADSEVASANPELLFQNAVDPDSNALTYQVKVLQGEAAVAQYDGLPEGVATTSAKVVATLEENGRYQWMVQAFDGEDASGWTAPQSFYVNAVQEAPAVPVPVAPLAGEVLDGEGVLSWAASVDADPFDSVSYLVEIADDASFAAPVAQQTAAGTTLTLAELTDHPALADGGAYFWRVKAVDNHGLASEPSAAGSFAYDTTVLKVTANMPGARVYLGGNHAYAGRFVGEVPFELRDFPAGPCSVLVERAGFEPFVAQVNPAYRENVAVYAELVPAIAPSDLRARPIQTAGADILLGADAAPFAVDFDNDGLIDLLLGDATGSLTLYKGMLTAEGAFYYTAGVSLALPLMPGATPFVADWDNDGRKDLLVGTADGTVLLYLNTATESAPAFGAASYLQVTGVPVDVGSSAVPAVVDWDGDGDKDLVVGSGPGAVTLFRNDGGDAIPQLVLAGNLAVLTGAVAPFFVDWDADGVEDLLLAASEHLYLYKRQASGTYAPAVVLSVGSDLLGKNGKSSTGAYSMGERLRLFAYDVEGRNGKDLIVGNAAGQVRLVASSGKEFVPVFTAALLDKVAQIDGMAREGAPDLLPLVADIRSAVEAGDFKGARRLSKVLEGSAGAGTELAVVAAELTKILP